MRRAFVLLSVVGVSVIGCSAITATDVSRLGPSGGSADAGLGVRDGGPPPGDAGGLDAGAHPDGAIVERDACTPVAENCANGVDDDCDSLVDHADPDCAAPPPPPDFCMRPGALAVGTPARGSTAGLADDTTSACRTPGMTPYPDVFYTLHVDADADLYLDTFGSAFDTILSLRTGCESGSEIACSNDASSLRTSRVIYRNVPHGDYIVVVDGDRDRPAGDYTLNARTMPSAPRISCENALDITGGGAVFGRTEGMSIASGPCGGVDSPEEVFQFTLTARTMVALRTAGSDFDTVLYVRPRICPASAGGTSIACNDDTAGGLAASLDLDLMPGTYFVFLDGASGAAGNYRLVAYFGPMP